MKRRRRTIGPRKARLRRARREERSGSPAVRLRAWRDSRHGLVLRSWLVFVACFATLHTILAHDPGSILEYANEWTARATALALWLIGMGGHAQGTTVYSEVLPVRIIAECTGIVPILLFTSAVIAYPCRWRPKLLGILLGVPAILLCNLIRLVSLCLVGHWFPEAFEVTHLLVWQSLIVFLTIVVWIVWTLTCVRSDAEQPA